MSGLDDFLKKKNKQAKHALTSSSDEIVKKCRHLLERIQDEGSEKYDELYAHFRFRYDKVNVQKHKVEKFLEELQQELDRLGKDPIKVLAEYDKLIEKELEAIGHVETYQSVKKSTKKAINRMAKAAKEVSDDVEEAVEEVKRTTKKVANDLTKKAKEAKKEAKKVVKKATKKVAKKTAKKAAKKVAKKTAKKVAKKTAKKTAK
ncbi:hypothetical protein ABMA79_10965, partial [Halobacteriovorax sp. HFRX-2_2]